MIYDIIFIVRVELSVIFTCFGQCHIGTTYTKLVMTHQGLNKWWEWKSHQKYCQKSWLHSL